MDVICLVRRVSLAILTPVCRCFRCKYLKCVLFLEVSTILPTLSLCVCFIESCISPMLVEAAAVRCFSCRGLMLQLDVFFEPAPWLERNARYSGLLCFFFLYDLKCIWVRSSYEIQARVVKDGMEQLLEGMAVGQIRTSITKSWIGRGKCRWLPQTRKLANACPEFRWEEPISTQRQPAKGAAPQRSWQRKCGLLLPDFQEAIRQPRTWKKNGRTTSTKLKLWLFCDPGSGSTFTGRFEVEGADYRCAIVKGSGLWRSWFEVVVYVISKSSL